MTKLFRKDKEHAREKLQKMALCKETTLTLLEERLEIYEKYHEKDEELKKNVYRNFVWLRLQDTEIEEEEIEEAMKAYKKLYKVDDWLKKAYKKAVVIRLDEISAKKALLEKGLF